VAGVKQAYLTLKATIANVAVQQRSLELAEVARQNKIRVDAGQIAPLISCRPRQRSPSGVRT
jgi:hypothetical protein